MTSSLSYACHAVVQSFSHVQLFTIPWAIACQAAMSWDFPSKNTGVDCHVLLQGIFPNQGSNPHLLHWQVDSLPLSHCDPIYQCREQFTLQMPRHQPVFQAGLSKASSLGPAMLTLFCRCPINRWVKGRMNWKAFFFFNAII